MPTTKPTAAETAAQVDKSATRVVVGAQGKESGAIEAVAGNCASSAGNWKKTAETKRLHETAHVAPTSASWHENLMRVKTERGMID
jgi:hypothetical protein